MTLYSTQVKKSWKLNHIEISAKGFADNIILSALILITSQCSVGVAVAHIHFSKVVAIHDNFDI